MSILYTDPDGMHHAIHGYIGVVGPPYSPRFFTGTSLHEGIDNAKVYNTPGGLKYAMQWYYEHNQEIGSPWSHDLWITRRAVPVKLSIVGNLT